MLSPEQEVSRCSDLRKLDTSEPGGGMEVAFLLLVQGF